MILMGFMAETVHPYGRTGIIGFKNGFIQHSRKRHVANAILNFKLINKPAH